MTPRRTADTMSEAIALSSPSGRMSNRARKGATDRLAIALFGDDSSLFGPVEKSESEKKEAKVASLLLAAKNLRMLAARGMSTRKFNKEADKLEQEATQLE